MTDGQAGDPDRAPAWVRRLTVVLVALAAVGIAATWLLGGFELRRDYGSAEPGEEVDAGNLVFTVTDATAQQQSSGTWTVIVNGTVRNPNDESLAPITGNSGNLAVARGGGTPGTVLRDYVLGGTWRRTVVAPGGPAVSLAAEFQFPDGSTFADTLRVGVIAMEHTDNSILGIGGGELVWNEDSSVRPTTVIVPLTILPAQS